ncbi:MAG TPA: hypothetical protein VKA95_14345 [Nitrososphaeraceae archaeon]|nr:hypothetical protein [Nitrososphaeraceae archaeon]
MTIRGEDPESLVEKINKIIPRLNGINPEIQKVDHFGNPQPAKSELEGPKVMTKNRDLVLLYIGK